MQSTYEQWKYEFILMDHFSSQFKSNCFGSIYIYMVYYYYYYSLLNCSLTVQIAMFLNKQRSSYC